MFPNMTAEYSILFYFILFLFYLKTLVQILFIYKSQNVYFECQRCLITMFILHYQNSKFQFGGFCQSQATYGHYHMSLNNAGNIFGMMQNTNLNCNVEKYCGKGMNNEGKLNGYWQKIVLEFTIPIRFVFIDLYCLATNTTSVQIWYPLFDRNASWRHVIEDKQSLKFSNCCSANSSFIELTLHA